MSRVLASLFACLFWAASNVPASALTVGTTGSEDVVITTSGAAFTLECDLCVLATPVNLAIVSDPNTVLGTSAQLAYYNANLNLGPDLTSSDIFQTTTSGTGGGLSPTNSDLDLDFASSAALLWFQIDGPQGAVIFLRNLTGNEAQITYTGLAGTGAGMSHVVSAVPVPPALFLFASALVAFFGVGRARRRREAMAAG